jgi:hypothetical protein
MQGAYRAAQQVSVIREHAINYFPGVSIQTLASGANSVIVIATSLQNNIIKNATHGKYEVGLSFF